MLIGGDIWRAYVQMVVKNRAAAPSLHDVINGAGDAIIRAVTRNERYIGEPAFDLGPHAYWVKGWPVGQWVSEHQVFGSGTARIVALEIFDPDFRESVNWFIQSADRRRYDVEFEITRRPRHATPVERDTVENPIALARLRLGHEVRRQVVVPDGRIDIYDATTNEIIECKPGGSASDLIAAVKQLRRYQVHFPSAILTVAVPEIEADALWLANLLRQIVRIIEVNRDVEL